MASDTLRQVTGTFKVPDGELIPNRPLKWRRFRRVVQAQGTSVILDEPFWVTTDAAGAIDTEVVAGNYVVMVDLADAKRSFNIVVPDEVGPHDISDILDGPVIDDATVTQIQALIDEAETAEAAAAASAAAAADSAELADSEGNATLALQYRNAAEAFKDGAETAQGLSEAARDAAFVNAVVYANTTDGLAAVAEDEQFQVVSGDEIIRYRDDAGVATEVARYPAADFVLDKMAGNNGSVAVWAATDSAGEVAAYVDDEGNFYTAADPTRAVNDRGLEAEESAGLPIVAFQDTHGNDALVQQSDGRFWTARDGYGFEEAASKDVGLADAYDVFGQVNKAHFLRDRAASARGNQVIIDRICCTWNEDPLTNFARMATVLPLSDTTGIEFFVQRRDIANNPDQTGERGLRLVMRTYAIDYEAQDITFSATTVLDEPPQWESDGLGKSFPCSAIKISGGPNDGRILILYMVLDSATGLQEAPSELHLYKMQSDDNGVTFAPRELVFDASDAYAALGIAQHDGVSGYGPAGNYLLQLPADHPVAPGRIVAAAPITSGTTSWHQGCIYSDDYGGTWTHGTYQQIASTFYNEAFLSVARDDSLVMYVRTEEGRGSSPFEHTPGRGAFRSTDGGATFTYLGYNETAGFNNCASALLRTSYAPKDGWPKMLIGGPQTVSNDRRNYRLRVAYDDSAQVFVGEWGPFPDEQGISYTHLSRMENGLYLMAYETFPVSFNTQSSVGLLVFNEAALMAGATLITE